MWGGPLATGRSAFLLWTFVGVDLHLAFAIIVTVLIKEWLRIGRGGQGRHGCRVRRVGCSWLANPWKFVANPTGRLRDRGDELECGFHERLREAWRRELWRRDTKTTGALPTSATPLLRPHRRFAQDGRAQALRVAAAAATDGCDLARLHAPKDCPCGEPDPSRHHRIPRAIISPSTAV